VSRPALRARRWYADQGRNAVLTLTDQFVSSATNFAIGVLVARAGGADALGAFGIAFLIWLAVLALSRALISEPMTVGDATGSGDFQLREGMLATLLLGAGVAVCLAAAGGLLILAGASGVAVLALAPWIPGLLLQDYWRGMAFRLQRPARALTSDVVFAVAQGSSTLALFALDVHSVAAFIASWGIGATAGALVGLFQSRVRVSGRGGLTHLRSLWARSRWFLAESGTAFLSDQGYLLLLPLVLGTAQFGVYRAGASLVGPAVIIFLAGGNAGLPECVRRLRQHGMPGLLAYIPRLSAAVLGLTTVYCVLVAILARPMLRLAYGAEFADAAVITQLVAAQYVLFAIGFGCGVALKAAGQMRRLWAMRTVGALISITAVLVLASSLRLAGAGLAGVVAGAAYTVGIMVIFQRMRVPGREKWGTCHGPCALLGTKDPCARREHRVQRCR
jgi:O-antigen/teichoic acid export membrane protein